TSRRSRARPPHWTNKPVWWGRPPTEASVMEKPWLMNPSQQVHEPDTAPREALDVVLGDHAEAAVVAGHAIDGPILASEPRLEHLETTIGTGGPGGRP